MILIQLSFLELIRINTNLKLNLDFLTIESARRKQSGSTPTQNKVEQFVYSFDRPIDPGLYRNRFSQLQSPFSQLQNSSLFFP
jgi:hypothetical protein